MAEWKVCIVGDDAYLADLSAAFSSSDTRLVKHTDGYLVSGGLLSSCRSEQECRDAVGSWLEILNGTATLLGGATKPISVNYVLFKPDSGPGQMYATFNTTVGVGTVSFRAVLTRVDGTTEVVTSATEVPRWMQLASNNEAVRSVLRLVARNEWTWTNLYRILEVIRADAGGIEPFLAKGWISKSTHTRFTRSANHPEVAGDDARHGHDTSQPPTNPMDIQEAKSVVIALVHQWIAAEASSGA